MCVCDKSRLISTVSAEQLIKGKKTAELSTLAFEAAWCNLKYRGVSAGFNIKKKCMLHSSAHVSTWIHRLPRQET